MAAIFFNEYFMGVLFFYFCCYIINYAFETCLHISCQKILRKIGINIGFLTVEWESNFIRKNFLFMWNLFNAFISKSILQAFHRYSSLLISILQIIVSILFVIASIIQFATFNKIELVSIKFVVPGYGNSVLEYLPIFVLCSLIHEFGHYFSAKLFNVNPISFQFKFIYFIPLSSIVLNNHAYYKLKRGDRLTILTSGILYNILLFFFLQIMISNLNLEPSNDVVLNQIRNKNSPLFNYNGLRYDDRISQINNCKTTTIDLYYKCIEYLSVSPQIGICTKEKYKFFNNTLKKCNKNEILFYPYQNTSLKTCIDVRDFLNNLKHPLQYCRNDGNCTRNYKCLIPFIENENKENFQLIFITKNTKHIIAYVGYVTDFLKTFDVIETNLVHDLLVHLANISLNFAFFNLLPCLNFDGYLIFFEIINCLPIQKKYKLSITSYIMTTYTFLMIIQLLISFYKLHF